MQELPKKAVFLYGKFLAEFLRMCPLNIRTGMHSYRHNKINSSKALLICLLRYEVSSNGAHGRQPLQLYLGPIRNDNVVHLHSCELLLHDGFLGSEDQLAHEMNWWIYHIRTSFSHGLCGTSSLYEINPIILNMEGES